MLRLSFALFVWTALIGCSTAFLSPVAKEPLIPDVLLREVVDRMGRDLADAADAAYLDFPDTNRMPLGALMSGRAAKDLDGEEPQFPLDYDHLAELASNPSPSIRDQEYLQHSTLWGHQYMTGGSGEGEDAGRQVKTDALPSYCNPPNPCPLGHGAEDGCLAAFENTAGFSRRYQAQQDCMCDTEHMFDCPSGGGRGGDGGGGGGSSSNGGDQRGSRDNGIMRDFSVGDRHPTLVAKKYHIEKDENPFLHGERLPVAAKKGNNVVY